MMRRLTRIAFILLAFMVALITGTYYTQAPLIRTAHHLLVNGALIIGMIWLWRRGGLPRHPLTLPTLAAIGVWLLASALAIDPRVSLENAWFPIAHALIALILIALVQRGRATLIVETQFMLAVVVALFGLVHLGSWYFGWGIAPSTDVGWAEVTALAPLPIIAPQVYMPLGVSTWLAAYTAPLALLAFAYGMVGRRGVRVGFFVLAGMLTIVLLATGSRGGLIALAVGAVAWVGLQIARTTRVGGDAQARRVWIGVGAAIAAVAVVGVLVIGRNVERFTGDALRLNLWRGAIAIGADRPILGVGVGMFGRAYREAREPYGVHDNRLGTAHNAYLNTFAETGLIGLGVMLLGGAAIVIAGWRRWRAFDDSQPGGRAARLRWMGAAAALIGFGAQSMVDTFISPPLALLTVALVVLVTADTLKHDNPSLNRTWRDRAARWGAMALAGGVGAAAIGLWASDSAYADFREAGSLAEVEAIAARDPQLDLYTLQIADLRGRAGDPDADTRYADALERAPTWDMGWINRAALAEARGDDASALDYLDRARAIDRFNGATVHWARIAESTVTADDQTIIAAYFLYFDGANLPFSTFWWETPLRRAAVEALTDGWLPANADLAYRVLRVHDPDRLNQIVGMATAKPEAARSAGDWWVIGEDSMQTGDIPGAMIAFTEAMRLDRRNGDYAAARARARIVTDPTDPLIEVDLKLAELLGTRYESVNAIRASIAPDEESRRRLLANAVPPLVIDQNFEGVSYGGRVVGFTPFESMREPGLGAPLLQPWVDLAASYESAGDMEAAAGVRRAIAGRVR